MSPSKTAFDQTVRRLPIGYYADHFRQVLKSVEGQYGHFLTSEERDWLRRLDGLGASALSLYARLVNRRGPCFRVDRLRYVEIADVHAAMTELIGAGFLVLCVGEFSIEHQPGVLNCFTVPELRASLHGHNAPNPCKRAELLAWLFQWDGLKTWLSAWLTAFPVVHIANGDPWPFLRFLFFGELRDNLSDFVTRALGHVVPEIVDPDHLASRFASRREADDAYRMAMLYSEFRAVRGAQTPVEILVWWQAKTIDRASLLAGHGWFDRVVDRLGHALEREGRRDQALALYETSPVAPARERRARLLIEAGRMEEAITLLRAMSTAPCHAEEAYAARQVLGRLEKTSRRSEARDLQYRGETLVLDYEDGRAEAAALAHFHAAGWQGVHSENWLWCGLFGLMFWDIIYDATTGAFHSPLQIAPADLYEPNFYRRREQAIEARLSTLSTPATALRIIDDHFRAKHGIANPFVHWKAFSPRLAHIMVNRLPLAGLAAALRRIAMDVRNNTRGLPDLFIWNANMYRFIEIKAQNDHLAPHQFEWLGFLAGHGIEAVVQKIRRPLDV